MVIKQHELAMALLIKSIGEVNVHNCASCGGQILCMRISTLLPKHLCDCDENEIVLAFKAYYGDTEAYRELMFRKNIGDTMSRMCE